MKSVQLCLSVQPPVHVCALLQAAKITHAGSGTDPSTDPLDAQAGRDMDTRRILCLACLPLYMVVIMGN